MISKDAQGNPDASPSDPADAIAESKTSRKRQAEAMQDLGKRLADLKPDVRAQFDLPDELHHAINEYNRFKSNEARRRQLQFIGKRMRQLDVEPIVAQLNVVDGNAASVKHELHQLEQWRERLLLENSALTEFIDAYPHTDRQALRNMVRKARREADTGQETTQARALLRFLREVLHQES